MGVVDHVIPTHPVAVDKRTIMIGAAAQQAANFTRNCAEHGIHLFDVRDHAQGIEHVVAPEIGLIRPGMVVLCGDSHTTTYGALGALGFGIGTSEVEHVLATQTLVYRVAKDMRIVVDGALPRGTTSKDLVLYIIAKIGAQGARGYVVEYAGSAIDALSAEARMTLCNMTVEAGARGALIAPTRRRFAMSPSASQPMHSSRNGSSSRPTPTHRSTSRIASTRAMSRRSSHGARARIRPSRSMRAFPASPMNRSRNAMHRRRWTTWDSMPIRRSTASRSITYSSVHARTRASKTCAPSPISCAAARSRLPCVRWSCPVPAWSASRRNAKASPAR